MNDKELEQLSSLINQDYLKDLFDKFSLILESSKPRIIYRKIRGKKVHKKYVYVRNLLVENIIPSASALRCLRKIIKKGYKEAKKKGVNNGFN